MYVLGGSLVVLLAAGVPLAKSWLRPMPTVVVSDFAPETPRAATAATNADARSSVRSNAPVATPRAGASATAPAPANTPTAAKKSPDTATRQTAPRGDRAPHAILARNAHNAPAPAPAAAAPAPTAAPPPEPVVETPAPAPVETVAAIPMGPIFEMGQVDDKPRVASQVEPQLPDELRDRPLTDLVILRVLVAQNGRAADVNVLRKSKAGAALDTAVVSAVRKWSFSPARKRGQVVSCWYNVGVPLRLEGRTSP
jgi:protein TonB